MLSKTLPNRSEKQHHNINQDNVFGPRERRRKIRWTSAPLNAIVSLA
jgi:hypothetical protein